MDKKVIVVGAGFGGLACAALLAQAGFSVTVLEKNDQPGGRARVWKEKGFVFDMGPSWYLMPEVFEDLFAALGRKRQDYYRLSALDPYYQVFFSQREKVVINANLDETAKIFDGFEAEGGAKLRRYLELARFKYDVAMREFMDVEYRSVFQFFNRKLIVQGLKMNMFSSLDGFVRRFFSDRRARQILEYAMVFLGASPQNAPALYSIMSHVDLNLGVFYPDGGFGSIVDGLVKLCEELGVSIVCGAEVDGYEYEGKRIVAARSGGRRWVADAVVVNADYRHAEVDLLPPERSSIKESRWRKKIMAPSMFIMYLGIDKKLPGLQHHNLYFAEQWDDHFKTIFDRPSWPENPCFYLSCPSKTDPTVAPPGQENLFVLIPVAPGMEDGDAVRQAYAEKILDHIEHITGESIRDHIIVKRLYSQRDFSGDYHAYKGSALGMAHVLSQTAIFRPSLRSRKVPNLFYAGQYTHPGVGVPMVLIAAQLAARAVSRSLGINPKNKGGKA